MIISFVSTLSPVKLIADISPDMFEAVMVTGMFDSLRIDKVELAVHEDEGQSVWYSFSKAKAGLPPLSLEPTEEGA